METVNWVYYALVFLTFGYSLYFIYYLLGIWKKNASLKYSSYLLALAMVLVVIVPVVEVLQFMPGWPWQAIRMLSLFLFIVSLHLIMKKVNETMSAHEELKKAKFREREF